MMKPPVRNSYFDNESDDLNTDVENPPIPDTGIQPQIPQSNQNENLDLAGINKLLSMYGSQLGSQYNNDNKRYSDIESILKHKSEQELSPDQYKEAIGRANLAKGIANIFQAANLNGSGQAFKDIGDSNYKMALSPIETAKYLQGVDAQKAKDQMDLGGLQRSNLKEFGGDIENLLQSSKPYEALKIERDKNSKDSAISQSLQSQLIDWAKLKKQESLANTRPQYKRLGDFYDKIIAMAGKSSYNQLQEMMAKYKDVFGEAKTKVDQDIKEKGYAMMADKFAASQGDHAFEQRKELNKVADKFDTAHKLVNDFDRLEQLLKDPEVIKSKFNSVRDVINSWTDSENPKQKEFAELITRLSAPEQHEIYAGSVTGDEFTQRNKWLPTSDDNITSLISKIPRLHRNNNVLIKSLARQHYYLATGKNLSSIYGDDEKKYIHYDPFNIGPESIGQVKESKSNIVKSPVKTVSQRTPDEMKRIEAAKRILKNPDATPEHIKAAQSILDSLGEK